MLELKYPNFIYILIHSPFVTKLTNYATTVVETGNTVIISDFSLFLLGFLFIYGLRSVVNRPVIKLLVDLTDHKANTKLPEIPILFKLFPLCFLFVYDIEFYYKSDPTRLIARFTLPFQIPQLKWYIEILYLQCARRNLAQGILMNEINVMANEGLEYEFNLKNREYDNSCIDMDFDIALLDKMEAVLRIFLITYKLKGN